jgi:hypothetical protein
MQDEALWLPEAGSFLTASILIWVANKSTLDRSIRLPLFLSRGWHRPDTAIVAFLLVPHYIS